MTSVLWCSKIYEAKSGALAIARDATERYTQEKVQWAELNKLENSFEQMINPRLS